MDPWFQPSAYVRVLLRDSSYPCLFYPVLFGANYKDKGKDGNEYEIYMPKVENIELLLRARCDFAFGVRRDYFDHPNCIGWIREGNDQHNGCAVVISNGDQGTKVMEIGKRYAGRTFVDLLKKSPEEVTINEDGLGEFFSPAGSLSVWIEKI